MKMITLLFLLVTISYSCSGPKVKKEIAYRHEKKEQNITNEILKINQLTKKIQRINFLVASMIYDEAIREIKSLIKKYPQNYVFYDMEGSVHYIQGNNELAAGSFEKSLELNPKNKQAQSMLKKSKGPIEGAL